jgi:hypothetical protein
MCKLSLKAGRAGVLCGVLLFQAACGAAFAETADAPSLASTPAASGGASTDSLPFGGCEPLGMTASGELVFPLECKRVIHRATEAPIASDDKIAPTDKPVADAQSAEVNLAGRDDKPAAPEKMAVADKPAAAVEMTAATAPKSAAAEPPSQTASPKKPNRRASKTVGPVDKQVAKQVALAKPAQAPPAKRADGKAAVRTAELPACAHYRSYIAASKSYRAFDGHMYACR